MGNFGVRDVTKWVKILKVWNSEVIFYSVSEGFITIFLNTLSDIFKSSTMEGIIYYIIISLMLKGVVG